MQPLQDAQAGYLRPFRHAAGDAALALKLGVGVGVRGALPRVFTLAVGVHAAAVSRKQGGGGGGTLWALVRGGAFCRAPSDRARGAAGAAGHGRHDAGHSRHAQHGRHADGTRHAPAARHMSHAARCPVRCRLPGATASRRRRRAAPHRGGVEHPHTRRYSSTPPPPSPGRSPTLYLGLSQSLAPSPCLHGGHSGGAHFGSTSHEGRQRRSPRAGKAWV